VSDDITKFEKVLLSLDEAGKRDELRRFALDCARAATDGMAAPPLWNEAIDLVAERVAGMISEGTFRHRAAALECRLPLLTVLSGLRRGDPHAAAALTVMAALRTRAVEAALDSARAERLQARMSAPRRDIMSPTQGADNVADESRRASERAVRHCLHHQVVRLGRMP